MVSVDRLKQLLHYNRRTGLFRWKVRRSTSSPAGSIAGRTESKGYTQIGVDGTRYMAHRLAWLWCHGDIPDGMVIDHKNGDRGDNRIVNLRLVSFTTNLHLHRTVHPRSKSGLLGVSYNIKSAACGKPWVARIQRFGKRVTLGTFTRPEEAYKAYQKARGT
jgi:hypothetical protein